MENRREFKRFKLLQVVEISFINGETFIDATSEDISLSGIRCRIKHPIKSGSEVFLMFEIPNGEGAHIIKCYCDISWQKKNGDNYIVGLFFKYLHKDDSDILESYLNNLKE